MHCACMWRVFVDDQRQTMITSHAGIDADMQMLRFAPDLEATVRTDSNEAGLFWMHAQAMNDNSF